METLQDADFHINALERRQIEEVVEVIKGTGATPDEVRGQIKGVGMTAIARRIRALYFPHHLRDQYPDWIVAEGAKTVAK